MFNQSISSASKKLEKYNRDLFTTRFGVHSYRTGKNGYDVSIFDGLGGGWKQINKLGEGGKYQGLSYGEIAKTPEFAPEDLYTFHNHLLNYRYQSNRWSQMSDEQNNEKSFLCN